MDTWRTTQVRRYRRTNTVHITELDCLWYGSFRSGHPFGQPPRRQPVSRGVHDLDVVMIFYPVITDEHHRGPLLLPLPPAMP